MIYRHIWLYIIHLFISLLIVKQYAKNIEAPTWKEAVIAERTS